MVVHETRMDPVTARKATRRQALAGATGALAAAALTRREMSALAFQATPAVSPVTQPDMTGAVHSFQVGAFSCMAISDGVSLFTDGLGLIFGKTPPDEAERALREAGYDPLALLSDHTAILIDTGEQRVLVDTGVGPGWAPGEGLLLDNLRGAGIEPDAIDIVINTHGHGDHIGGNADPDGNPVYPNARYVMSQEDWDFWTDEPRVHDEAHGIPDFAELFLSFVRQHMVPLEAQFDLIGYDEEIVPGITSIAAQGHTPGHMALMVESEGERLWIGGDFVSHQLNFQHPEFAGLPDLEPERMIETRMRLLGRMAEEGGLATFYHVGPFPGLGTVVADGDVWQWEPSAGDENT